MMDWIKKIATKLGGKAAAWVVALLAGIGLSVGAEWEGQVALVIGGLIVAVLGALLDWVIGKLPIDLSNDV